MNKILVCGGRDFNDNKLLKIVLFEFLPFHLISGGAKGADKLAEIYAIDLKLGNTIIKADWDKHGKSAGYIRNREMINLNPDCIIAFWDSISRGTAHTIKLAKEKKITTFIWYY